MQREAAPGDAREQTTSVVDAVHTIFGSTPAATGFGAVSTVIDTGYGQSGLTLTGPSLMPNYSASASGFFTT